MLEQSLLWQRYLVINLLYISPVLISFVFCSRFSRSIFFMVVKRFFIPSLLVFLSVFFCAFLLFLIDFFGLFIVLLLLFRQLIRIPRILGPYGYIDRRFALKFVVKSFNKLRYLFLNPKIVITTCGDVTKKEWGVRAGFIARKCHKIYIKEHIFGQFFVFCLYIFV